MIKILYAGSPSCSAIVLNELLNSKDRKQNGGEVFEIVCVLSNPPSMQGRHKDLIETPVSSLALKNNIPVITPEHLNKNARDSVSVFAPDMIVCFAYGHIFGPQFLKLFKFGGINLHPSLLPKYRGATPCQEAILNMDTETGLSVQTISQKMDEGNILAQKKIKLNGHETTLSLLDCAALQGSLLILDVLRTTYKNKNLPKGIVQQGEASYTKIIQKSDGLIDWNKSAKEIDAKIRAYTPNPGCFSYIETSSKEKLETLRILEGKPLDDYKLIENDKIIKTQIVKTEIGKVVAFNKDVGIIVQCAQGFFAITRLQKQTKKEMDYKTFMNGNQHFVGTIMK